MATDREGKKKKGSQWVRFWVLPKFQEVEPETAGAREAAGSMTEGAREAPGQADPQERSTRRRRYHQIVVVLSEKEEDEEKRPQVPLTKRLRTYRPTHPRVVTSTGGVSPLEESPRPPPQEQRRERSLNIEEATQKQRREKMPAKTPVKESRPLPLVEIGYSGTKARMIRKPKRVAGYSQQKKEARRERKKVMGEPTTGRSPLR